jgi:hypothetical protein
MVGFFESMGWRSVMAARGLIAAVVFTVAGYGAAAFAVEAGVKARIAGDGPEAKYYLAKDVDAGIVINHLHTLEFYKSQGEPKTDLGYHLGDIDTALEHVRTTRDGLLKKGRIIEVAYNLPVTTVEKEQTVNYTMFPDTEIVFGKGYTATVTRIRVDEGPLKGHMFYARRLVDKTHVVATDRAWLRAPGMKAVPVSDDAQAVARFWKALAQNDKIASAQAYIDGNFTQLPLDTPCIVVRLSEDHAFAQVRATKEGEPNDFWVLATIASLESPNPPVPPAPPIVLPTPKR